MVACSSSSSQSRASSGVALHDRARGRDLRRAGLRDGELGAGAGRDSAQPGRVRTVAGAARSALAMHWGAYQGPVVFSVPDIAFLLGAPLPRRALAVRRLVLSLAGGAVAGTGLAAVVLVGLAGKGRGIDTSEAAGLIVGLAELGTTCVAGAWAVERSKRIEHAFRRAIGRACSRPWGWPSCRARAASGARSRSGPARGAGRCNPSRGQLVGVDRRAPRPHRAHCHCRGRRPYEPAVMRPGNATFAAPRLAPARSRPWRALTPAQHTRRSLPSAPARPALSLWAELAASLPRDTRLTARCADASDLLAQHGGGAAHPRPRGRSRSARGRRNGNQPAQHGQARGGRCRHGSRLSRGVADAVAATRRARPAKPNDGHAAPPPRSCAARPRATPSARHHECGDTRRRRLRDRRRAPTHGAIAALAAIAVTPMLTAAPRCRPGAAVGCPKAFSSPPSAAIRPAAESRSPSGWPSGPPSPRPSAASPSYSSHTPGSEPPRRSRPDTRSHNRTRSRARPRSNRAKGGIYLTQVGWRKCRRQARITRARTRSCWRGFLTRLRAWTTWSGCAGRTGSVARGA